MLVRLKELCLTFGLKPVFAHINLVIPAGQKIALVGRNGEGKSTFLKMLAGEILPDSGKIEFAGGAKVSYLPQSIPNIDKTVRQILAAKLSTQMEEWQIDAQVEKILAQFKLNGDFGFNDLSGGLKRRVLLAQAFVAEPDLLLLDEPTNHLDIDAIQFLEKIIAEYPKTVLFVSHDRQFTRKLATQIYDLDRGAMTSWECGYDAYLINKETQLNAERQERERFDKKLAQEEAWIRQGVKARRARNEGRVRALEAMRAQLAERRETLGTANLKLTQAGQSGKSVISAENIKYSVNGKKIIAPLTLEIRRGDKIGIIGPNGCGKTTLIKLLLKELAPDEGTVKIGTQLDVLYFDQLREQIDDKQTVLDNVSQGKSHIDFDGKTQHILGYLQHFLFEPERARSLAMNLSGGERNRLLLAKLFTRSANMLVMDEPSNDLDIETLELLESLLVNFNGTLLLVSHDRELINNSVTSTLAFEGDGIIQEYVGGYDDYLRQAPSNQNKKIAEKTQTNKAEKAPTIKEKLNYNEQKELARLPDKIAKTEADIAKLQETLAAAFLTEKPGSPRLNELTEQLKIKEKQLAEFYRRWEELEA